MGNIWKIIKADWRRLTASVVAVVTLIGLCIIPCLYAWFNIFSNWDPYGQASTSQIKIAVANEDRGDTVMGLSLNIGASVLSGLQSNKDMGWVFLDSAQEATDGVSAGKYYAALVIPAEFTAQFFSFLGEQVEHPQILYYENEKKNAIAPKITSKAKTAVQQQVNTTFINTAANALAAVNSVLHAFGLDMGDAVNALTGNLDRLYSNVQTLDQMLASLQALTAQATSMADYGQLTLRDLTGAMQSGEQGLSTAGGRLTQQQTQLATTETAALEGLDRIDKDLAGLYQTLDATLQDLKMLAAFQQNQLAGEKALAESLLSRLAEVRQNPAIAGNEQALARLDQAEAALRQLVAALDTLSQTGMTEEQLTAARTEALTPVTKAKEAVQLSALLLNGSIAPALTEAFTAAENALSGMQQQMAAVESGLSGAQNILSQYGTALTEASDSLSAAREVCGEVLAYTGQMSRDVHKLVDSNMFQKMVELLATNPEGLADYIASPLELHTVEVYEIHSYGSAMAPYYIMLALFVETLFCATLIHAKIDPPIPGVFNLRPWQAFWGRYFTFFAVGQAQALLTGVGCLFYVGIQCLAPWKFLLGCCVLSLNFSMMNFALVYALDNIGMALSVIILVLQVAGSGGSYPVDVLPPLFQKLYVAMPFHYGMDMVRETIAGLYGNNYWKYLEILLGMTVIFIIFGQVVYFPAKRLNAAIARSKEATGIMN